MFPTKTKNILQQIIALKTRVKFNSNAIIYMKSIEENTT